MGEIKLVKIPKYWTNSIKGSINSALAMRYDAEGYSIKHTSEWLQAYLSGVTVTTLAEECNVPRHKIYNAFKRHCGIRSRYWADMHKANRIRQASDVKPMSVRQWNAHMDKNPMT